MKTKLNKEQQIAVKELNKLIFQCEKETNLTIKEKLLVEIKEKCVEFPTNIA